MEAIEAWKNPQFLARPDARILRILAEYLEPELRLKKYHVQNTIIFWGSARILAPKQARQAFEKAKKERKDVQKAQRMLELSRYYSDAEKLAKMMTQWSKKLPKGAPQFLVATGGGDVGIMEAANKGASDAGGKSVGFGITLPNEQKLNKYITRELQLQFHYFFMRKFWMIYLAKALIAFPGGYGTLNELFEILTLIETHLPKKEMPVVLYGSKYWNSILNFEEMAKWGTISDSDKNIFKTCDTPEEAYAYLTKRLEGLYL